MHFLDFGTHSFWFYYLLGCSFIALALILERFIYFITLKQLPKMDCQHLQKALEAGRYPDECPKIRSTALKEALSLIFAHQNQDKVLRHEVLNAWFDNHKKEVYQRLKWLNLVALMALLGGILGSTLGFVKMITVLTSYAPSDFIHVLLQSLTYLAFGMMISFPVFILSKIFKIIGGFYLSRLNKSLKMLLLSLEHYPNPDHSNVETVCPYTGKK